MEILYFLGIILTTITIWSYISYKNFANEKYFEKAPITYKNQVVEDFNKHKNKIHKYYHEDQKNSSLYYGNLKVVMHISDLQDYISFYIRDPKYGIIYDMKITLTKVTTYYFGEAKNYIDDPEKRDIFEIQLQKIILGAYKKISEKAQKQFNQNKIEFNKDFSIKKIQETKEINTKPIKVQKESMTLSSIEKEIISLKDKTKNIEFSKEINKILKVFDEIRTLNVQNIDEFKNVETQIISRKGPDLINLSNKYKNIVAFKIKDPEQEQNIQEIEKAITNIISKIKVDIHQFKINYIQDTLIDAKVALEVG